MNLKNRGLKTAILTEPKRLEGQKATVHIQRRGHFYKINWHSELPTCECGAVATPIWENNGFNGDNGPRMDEITGFECPNHGKIL